MIKLLKTYRLIIFMILISSQLYGFYGDGGGRSFIDFLMDMNQFRARTDQVGVLLGPSNYRFTVGFSGRTSGIILDNWTNDYKGIPQLTVYLRPGVTVGFGVKTENFNFGLGYQFRYLHKDYQVHTPMFTFTALDNTLRFNLPIAIGVGSGNAKNTYIVSTGIETRYYPKWIIDQIRLYIFYGYARISYAKYGFKEENLQIDENAKNVYKDMSSLGFDLRIYFRFLKESRKQLEGGKSLSFSIEPYFRFLYNCALRTLENQGGRHIRYGGNNYDINAYGFDPDGLSITYGVTEKFTGGYISSLPQIPNPQGQNTISDIYRIGLAFPVGFRVQSEYYGLYLEPSLSLTLIDGKNISISGVSKRGPFFTLGWVIYGEIFLTPIPEIELYLAVQTGGATRLGGALDPAYLNGTSLIFNTDCGITYYF
ncbi:hypothetical protein [uncultured Brachyspira sp.]|uniref:hypothetical protein n=1 Tax=uncultured Brachyspira sp. TaxID=221953 RepID=UPI0025897DFF|nr:hypothetical protein [uncultured Brachyspira sp.]